MIHEMRLHAEAFQRIESGTKRYEIRLWDEKRRSLLKGDTIVFSLRTQEDKKVFVKVTDLIVASTFQELFSALDLSLLGYDESITATFLSQKMNTYYSPEDELRYGVVAIAFELL